MTDGGRDDEHLSVRDRAGVGEARLRARARAAEAGFSGIAVQEIELVASELASNLVKHAGEGTLRIFDLNGSQGGIGIETTDLGPGIADPEDAIGDGVSTAGSLGYGLGTVNRLMDSVEIAALPDQERGTKIVCTRVLRKSTPERGRLPLSFGVASRPHPDQTRNGDTYLIKRWGEQALVAAIDGLGHGQLAFRASQAARLYLERHYDLLLPQLFRGVNLACRGTRGVVMALARFDLAAGSVEYASVGNIEGRLWEADEHRGLIAHRGVIGLRPPSPIVQRYSWNSDSLLVLHSDGLSSRWSSDEVPNLRDLPAMQGARELLSRFATRGDDAVVVVVKGGSQ